MDTGRKLNDINENPIDKLIYYNIVIPIVPVLHKLNFTPNLITMFSFISGLISIYLLYKKKYIESTVFYILNYLFDCMDGYMARKYNKITKFGDYFDHITDVIVNISIPLIFLYRKEYYKVLIIILFSILMFMYFKCQENIYDKKEESIFLNMGENIYNCKNKNNMKYIKHFGSGSFLIIVSSLILHNKYYK